MPRDFENRRTFLQVAASTAAAGLFGNAASADATAVPYRTLGHTGERASCIGLGGHHIGRPKDSDEGIRIIRSAIDRGVNFSTTAGIWVR